MIYTAEEEKEEALSEEAELLYSAEKPRKQGSIVPVLQVIICALILLALAAAKFARPNIYMQITDWYHTEQSQLIELPSWAGQDTADTADTVSGEESIGLLRV